MNNIILADEINRTSPKTQASLLEAMGEGQVTVDGKVYQLEAPFMVIATQNPIDFLGTYNLPEAQLDRFLMRISLGYPDEGAEQRMAADFLSGKQVSSLKPVASRTELLEMQDEVNKVSIHKDIIAYAVSLIEATRKHASLTLGASPRATLALLSAARAAAYLEGRSFVIPEDIQKMSYPVLCHRFVLSMDAKMKKTAAEDVLRELLRNVLVPVMK